MPNAILDPISTQAKRESLPRSQRLGMMDDDLEGEQRERGNETPFRGTLFFNKQAAETAWNSVGGLTRDTGDALVDLAKQFIGIGVEQVAQNAQENPASTASATITPSDRETKVKIEALQSWFKQMKDAHSIENYKQEADESLRITGRTITKEEARKEGYSDETAISTLHGFAKKDSEIEQNVEERKQDTSLAETNPAVVNLNAISEGGTGGAATNLSTTGGGAG